MIKKILAVAIVALAPLTANAAAIGIGAFTAPTIEEFEGFSGANFIASPLALNGVTYTSGSGTIRTFEDTAAYANCFGGCITTHDSPNDYIEATFATTFDRVGAFAGSSEGPLSSNVEFFDSLDNLLGSVLLSSLSAGDLFAGFESLVGIKRVRFNDLADNGVVLSLDRLHYENISAVPLPAGLPLMASALGLMGFLGWRKKRTAA